MILSIAFLIIPRQTDAKVISGENGIGETCSNSVCVYFGLFHTYDLKNCINPSLFQLAMGKIFTLAVLSRFDYLFTETNNSTYQAWGGSLSDLFWKVRHQQYQAVHFLHLPLQVIDTNLHPV